MSVIAAPSQQSVGDLDSSLDVEEPLGMADFGVNELGGARDDGALSDLDPDECDAMTSGCRSHHGGQERLDNMRPDGATTLAELVCWRLHLAKQLCDYDAATQSDATDSKRRRRTGFIPRIVESLKRGMYLISCFSGCGGPETVSPMIVDTFRELYDDSIEPDCVINYAAIDYDPVCRYSLRCHNNRTRPQCLFSDAMELVYPQVRADMEKFHAKAMAEFKKRLLLGEQKSALVDELGLAVYNHCVSALVATTFSVNGYCYISNSFQPFAPPNDGREVCAHGGIPCLPWTPAGSQLRWLDSATLPVLTWAFWLLVVAKPIRIFIECSHLLQAFRTCSKFVLRRSR